MANIDKNEIIIKGFILKVNSLKEEYKRLSQENERLKKTNEKLLYELNKKHKFEDKYEELSNYNSFKTEIVKNIKGKKDIKDKLKDLIKAVDKMINHVKSKA